MDQDRDPREYRRKTSKNTMNAAQAPVANVSKSIKSSYATLGLAQDTVENSDTAYFDKIYEGLAGIARSSQEKEDCIDRLLIDNCRLQKDLNYASKKASDVEQQLQTETKSRQEAQDEKVALEKVLIDKEAELEKVTEENRQLKEKETSMVLDFRGKADENATLRGEFDKVSEDLVAQHKALEDIQAKYEAGSKATDDAEARVTELLKQLSLANAEKKELVTASEEAKSKYKIQEADLRAAQERVKALEIADGELVNSIKDYKGALQTANSRFELQVKKSEETRKEQENERRQTAEQLKSSLLDVDARAQAVEKLKADLKREKDLHMNELSRLEKELVEAKETRLDLIAKMRVRLQDFEDDKKARVQRGTRLEKEISSQKTRSEADIARHEKIVAELEQKVEELQEQLKEVKGKYEGSLPTQVTEHASTKSNPSDDMTALRCRCVRLANRASSFRTGEGNNLTALDGSSTAYDDQLSTTMPGVDDASEMTLPASPLEKDLPEIASAAMCSTIGPEAESQTSRKRGFGQRDTNVEPYHLNPKRARLDDGFAGVIEPSEAVVAEPQVASAAIVMANAIGARPVASGKLMQWVLEKLVPFTILIDDPEEHVDDFLTDHLGYFNTVGKKVTLEKLFSDLVKLDAFILNAPINHLVRAVYRQANGQLKSALKAPGSITQQLLTASEEKDARSKGRPSTKARKSKTKSKQREKLRPGKKAVYRVFETVDIVSSGNVPN